MSNEARITQRTILPEGKSLYCDQATKVEIQDEAGGEFILVSQCTDGFGKVGIEPDEWPLLRDVIDEMIKKCRTENESGEMV